MQMIKYSDQTSLVISVSPYSDAKFDPFKWRNCQLVEESSKEAGLKGIGKEDFWTAPMCLKDCFIQKD